MEWEQIENKWAAMTRRVRADWVTNCADLKSLSARRGATLDATPAIRTAHPTGTVADAHVKMPGA
jgi:hypothetical protein